VNGIGWGSAGGILVFFGTQLFGLPGFKRDAVEAVAWTVAVLTGLLAVLVGPRWRWPRAGLALATLVGATTWVVFRAGIEASPTMAPGVFWMEIMVFLGLSIAILPWPSLAWMRQGFRSGFAN
jgi:hypothetical protein